MRRRHRRKNNQRKIIILSVIGLLFIMVVGYSAFQTNLNINVKGNIKNKPISTTDLIKLVVTTGDGLYKSSYEEGRYIYRGANPDNYISFNNELWRILSVESNGTLKIRRASSIGNLQWDAKGNRDSSTSTYCTYASGYGCNAWAATDNLTGSPLPNYTQYYPNGNTSDSTTYTGTVIKDSTMNTYLNETYYNTLSDEAKSFVVEGTFDVSTPGYYTSTENISYDVQQVKQYQWKGKVALMTITEWMQTTSNTTCTSLNVAYNSNSTGYCNINNWMFDSSTSYEWSLSPQVTSMKGVGVLYVSSNAYVDNSDIASHSYAVRPVLYLKSDITLSGQGTSSSPYILSVN